jgi:hypothetical protein
MQHFRLRYLTNDVELFPGEFVIGRSEECQLSIDDAMISRRHVLLRVTASDVTLVDLGSRNGVTLNGTRVREDTPLRDGDRILIGKHELVLRAQDSVSRRNSSVLARTLGAIDLRQLELESGRPLEGQAAKELTRVFASFGTLAKLSDKALAMGRLEEAERLVSACFSDLMTEVRKGAAVTAEQLEPFDAMAMKLAGELSKASWVEWMLEVHRSSGVMLSGAVVESLLALGPRLKHLSRSVILDYVDAAMKQPLNPNERFRLQRLEGLARRMATTR